MDVLEALRIAIEAEMNAQEIYARLAEEASNVEVRSLFSYLSEYKMAHQRLLEAELNARRTGENDEIGMTSHWLRRLVEETGLTVSTTADRGSLDMDLEQCRLNVAITANIARILEGENANLLQKQIRYEQELAIAADIQRKLLPRELPQNAGLQIAAANIMARSVGGDYYDLMTNEQGQLALIVADSMGKGMSAALLMTTIRSIWRGFSASAVPPDQALDMVSRSVYSDLKAAEAFVTIFNALYDPATSVLRYSNAGHNPPIFRPASASKCIKLDIGGTPVGIFPDSQFSSSELAISEGDTVVIYTDGVVEASDGNDSLFGFEGLCDLVNQNHALDAEDIKNVILSQVNSHTGGLPQTDDITLVVLKKI